MRLIQFRNREGRRAAAVWDGRVRRRGAGPRRARLAAVLVQSASPVPL